MRRAQLSWAFLQAHPVATPTGGFVNPKGHISGPYPDLDDSDNRAWLAAELYRSTCDQVYGDAYVAFITSNNGNVGMGGNDFTDYRVEALWAFYYAKCANEPASYAATRKTIYNTMRSSAYGQQGQTLADTYKNSGRTDVPGRYLLSAAVINLVIFLSFFT